MARLRRKPLSPDGRLSNPDPEAWLEPADFAAVKAAGHDPALLAAIVVPDDRHRGSLHLRLSAGRHGDKAEQAEYVLTVLALNRRNAAINAWAEENGVDRGLATRYFYGQPA